MIRFSTAWAALEEYLKDDDKTKMTDVVDRHVNHAIRSNVLCAYYLAYYDIFDTTMEYTDELVGHRDDDDDEDERPPQSSLEEAIEYCCSNPGDKSIRDQWTVNHRQYLRDALLRARESTDTATDPAELSPDDVDWKHRLDKIEASWRQETQPNEEETTTTESSQRDASSGLDLGMYIGMFRTAMEIVGEQQQ